MSLEDSIPAAAALAGPPPELERGGKRGWRMKTGQLIFEQLPSLPADRLAQIPPEHLKAHHFACLPIEVPEWDSVPTK